MFPGAVAWQPSVYSFFIVITRSYLVWRVLGRTVHILCFFLLLWCTPNLYNKSHLCTRQKTCQDRLAFMYAGMSINQISNSIYRYICTTLWNHFLTVEEIRKNGCWPKSKRPLTKEALTSQKIESINFWKTLKPIAFGSVNFLKILKRNFSKCWDQWLLKLLTNSQKVN
jgi:hypothetical protein